MEISTQARRDLVDFLLLRDEPFHGQMELIPFLRRVWDLENMPSTDPRYETAEADIWQHMVNFFDWDDDFLLNNYLQLPAAEDEVFVDFLEEIVHPLVIPDEEERQGLVEDLNTFLQDDGLRLQGTDPPSGRPLYELVDEEGANAIRETYEVVLSFAGEYRDYVEKVAECLDHNEVQFFYDDYEEATLWGKDLAEHLQNVYRGSARYCVMFISEEYVGKVWPNHERASALERALEERQEYILPARFDDVDVPGLSSTIHYIDLNEKTPAELCKLILQKLGRIG